MHYITDTDAQKDINSAKLHISHQMKSYSRVKAMSS